MVGRRMARGRRAIRSLFGAFPAKADTAFASGNATSQVSAAFQMVKEKPKRRSAAPVNGGPPGQRFRRGALGIRGLCRQSFGRGGQPSVTQAAGSAGWAPPRILTRGSPVCRLDPEGRPGRAPKTLRSDRPEMIAHRASRQPHRRRPAGHPRAKASRCRSGRQCRQHDSFLRARPACCLPVRARAQGQAFPAREGAWDRAPRPRADPARRYARTDVLRMAVCPRTCDRSSARAGTPRAPRRGGFARRWSSARAGTPR